MIQNKCDIYIPLELNNILKEQYIFENLVNYVGDQKIFNGSSTWLNFEYLKDFGDPIEDWLPFYYQNWVGTG